MSRVCDVRCEHMSVGACGPVHFHVEVVSSVAQLPSALFSDPGSPTEPISHHFSWVGWPVTVQISTATAAVIIIIDLYHFA